MANHRRGDAIDILCKIRGDKDINDPAIAKEVELLEAVVEASHHKRNNYVNIFLGGRYSGKLHLGRRAVLGLALQQIQQWTGILVMVSWATKLFELSGFGTYKASWLSGLLNTTGVIGTAAAALVIDRLGRRWSLQISFIIQGISLFLVAALLKTSQDRAVSNPGLSQTLGTAGSSFTFTFVFFFCMVRQNVTHPRSDHALANICDSSTLFPAGSTAPRSGHKRSEPKATHSQSLAGQSAAA